MRHELLYHKEFIRLELCSTCKVAKEIGSHCLQSWQRVAIFRVTSETLTFWVPGSKLWLLCSYCFWKLFPSALSCHGCVPGFFVHWLVRLFKALTTFPLRTSLAWHRLRQFCLYPNLGALKAYCFGTLKSILLKEWKYISTDNNYCWQVIVIWIHQSYKNV